MVIAPVRRRACPQAAPGHYGRTADGKVRSLGMGPVMLPRGPDGGYSAAATTLGASIAWACGSTSLANSRSMSRVFSGP